MKKILTVLLLSICWQLYSQDLGAKHEVKLDLPYILATAAKLEYEQIFSEGTTFGVSGLYHFNDYYNITYHLLGFYRWYFGKEPISGFFLEANTGLFGGTYESWISKIGFEEKEKVDYTSFGAGVALGWKFVTDTGIVLDVFGGAVRITNDKGPEAFPRLGVCIGKRF